MTEKKISQADIEKEKERRRHLLPEKGSPTKIRYKIVLSNTKDTITIREEELDKVMKGIKIGGIVVCLEGIFNPSYFVAILKDEERTKAIFETEQHGSKFDEPSPFAKLISPKMEMLGGNGK